MKRLLVVSFVLLAMLIPVATRPAGSAAQTVGGVCADSEEAAFLQLINAYRAENGLGPLALSQTLNVAADAHSQDMATANIFSHTGSNGSSYVDRLKAAGYPDPFNSGENIFAGASTAAGAIEGWKNSPPHNASMLNPNFKAIGIARANNPNSQWGWYWTTVFGGTADALGCFGEPQAAQPPAAPIEAPATGPTPTLEGPVAPPTAEPTVAEPTTPANAEQPAAEPTATGEAPPTAATQPANELAPAGATETPSLPPTPAPTVAPPVVGACGDSEELALLTLANEFRAQNGLPPLALSPTLSAGADAHSQDMAANDFMAFAGSNGSTTEQRMTAAGYPDPAAVGDYIFSGSPTGAAVFDWMKSNTGAFLNPASAAIGIARANNPNSDMTWYWTISFGPTVDASCSLSPTDSAEPTAATADATTPTAESTPTVETAPAATDQSVVEPTATGEGAPTTSNPPAQPTEQSETVPAAATQASNEPTATVETVQAAATEAANEPAPTEASATETPSAPSSPTPTPSAVPTTAAVACGDTEELAFLTLANEFRAQNGLPPLALSPTLSAGADAHSQDMAANDFMDFAGSDGSTTEQRMTKAGYPNPGAVGDYIYAGNPTGAGAFAWMRDDTSALLDPAQTAIGIGRANNPNSTFQWYWTISFGPTVDASCSLTPTDAASAAQPPVDAAAPTAASTDAGTASQDPVATEAVPPGFATASEPGTGPDSDGDGIVDSDEQLLGTDPNLADSDGDGVSDFDELFVDGTDPLDPNSV